MRLILAVSLAIPAIYAADIPTANASIMCEVTAGLTKGTLKVRPGPNCPTGETKVDPVALGLQGPPGKSGAPGAQGAAGAQGAPGPAGPTANLKGVAIQWTGHGDNCLYVEDGTGNIRAGTASPICSDTSRQRFDIGPK
jgi:hypothetical protein